jgi:hypothetical protein
MTTTSNTADAQSTQPSKGKTIVYWATTGLLSVGLLGSGFAKLSAQAPLVENMNHLGFPPYLLSILGFWMVAGAIVLLVPGAARVKEWAYAGVVFQMTGAAASHMFAGDALSQSAPTLFFVGLAIASYMLRPASRRMTAPAQAQSGTAPLPSPAAVPAT